MYTALELTVILPDRQQTACYKSKGKSARHNGTTGYSHAIANIGAAGDVTIIVCRYFKLNKYLRTCLGQVNKSLLQQGKRTRVLDTSTQWLPTQRHWESMAVRKVIASGLNAAGAFAARHRNFVAGVGLGSGGAVVFNAAQDAAAQFKLMVERYGDAFLVTQSLQVTASADMLSIVRATLLSATAVTATGVAALLLRGLLVPSGGGRGMLTVCWYYDES